MMKKIFLGMLISLLAASLFLPQQIFAGTLLQISADPGVSIWLNKELVGKTSKEQNGLVLRDIPPGEYVLKASMPGYDATETLLTIADNQTIEWRIKLSKPAMQIEDSVRRIDSSMIRSEPTGTIILQSIPLNAEIFLDGESLGPTDKKITYVSAADHQVKFVYQKQELVKKFTLKADQSIQLKADFTKQEIESDSGSIETNRGPDVIKMQTARARKPAQFPHRKHQEMYDCANCHHGMDSEGKQVPYVEGMEVQHCITCHNPQMQNGRLNSLMLAAHTRCKGCHKKIVAESGTAGPIAKCSGCHVFENE